MKSLDDFYKTAGTRDGRRGDCKPCNLAAKKARYLADPATHIARVKRWQDANRERHNANQRVRRQRPEYKQRARDGHLRRKHGITLADFDRMLDEQHGVCAICGRLPREDISFHVDHDHETGRIRGLLCFKCNNALGDFEDQPEWLDQAAAYLTRDPELEPLIRNRVAELVASRTN